MLVFLQFLKRRSVLLAIVAITLYIAIVSGYEVLEWLNNRKTTVYALRYNNAIFLGQFLSPQYLEEDLITLAELSFKSNIGYQALAALQQAKILAKHGEQDAALAVWKHIAQDPVVPQPYREAATLLAVSRGLSKLRLSDLATLIIPLLRDRNPWRFSALETTAILAWQKNDSTTAHLILSHLAGDQQSPSSIRNHALSLLQIF